MPRTAGALVTVAEWWVRRPRAVRAAAPFACMAFLWWSSSRTLAVEAPNRLRELLHNGAHIIAFGGLAAGWWLALTRAPLATPQPGRGWVACALAVGYGVVDELHQSMVPGRVCSVADLMSDASGAGLALALLLAAFGKLRSPYWTLAALVLASVLSVLLATFGPW